LQSASTPQKDGSPCRAAKKASRVKIIEMLNRRLADATDLQLQSRYYWKAKGSHFMALRELFDKFAQGVEDIDTADIYTEIVRGIETCI
jgi:DNA-binding ferritin-like protein